MPHVSERQPRDDDRKIPNDKAAGKAADKPLPFDAEAPVQDDDADIGSAEPPHPDPDVAADR